MTIIILHGIDGYSGNHWQKWLSEQLLKDGHKVIMPTLPGANHPDRKTWLKNVKELIQNVKPGNLIVVAHSLGAVTALDLMENIKVRVFISVAGFGRNYGLKLNEYFLKERTINFDKVNENLGKAFVIYSDNDPYVPQDELKFLAESLKVAPEIVPGGAHLNTSAGYVTFSRLLEIIQGELLKNGTN